MTDLETLAKGTETEEGRIEGAWLDTYLDLKAAGLHWKKAAFAAWYQAPKGSRKPSTMVELANLLNYKSEQVFYKWQHQDWFQELGIERARQAIFARYIGDVDRATINAALIEFGSAGVAARKLFYEQAGFDRQRLEITGEDGGPIEVNDSRYANLSDAALDAAIARRLAGLDSGAGAPETSEGTGRASQDDPGSEGAQPPNP